MVLGIMQPYFLPYLGYWQLIAAVDRFVVYDDVSFIKGGWISRNRIKVGGEPTYVSLHLNRASPNRRICDIALIRDPVWPRKLVRTVEQAYALAPYFGETMPLVRQVVECPDLNLADYLFQGIRAVVRHLGIKTELMPTSRTYGNNELKGPTRVIDICRREGASTYINSAGGRDMYFTRDFAAAGIELRFYAMRPFEYRQGRGSFHPFLSIVDLLMWTGRRSVSDRLADVDVFSA